MTKTINVFRIGFISMGVLLAIIFVSSVATPKAHAAITSELDFGSTGGEVTELQQFLASNSLIYPAGTVSGYFGPLTRAAVIQFQVAYGIPQVGRVGPMTQAKVNSIMSSGFGLDTATPIMGNLSVQANRNDTMINWTTNELTHGQVYYDTSPIRSDESTAQLQSPYVSGTSAPNNVNVSTSQSVNLQGLQANTLYYYFTRAIDNSGNSSVTLSKTFHTSQ